MKRLAQAMTVLARSRLEFGDVFPIDFQPETGCLRQVHHAIPDLGPALVYGVVQWVAAGIAVRLGCERCIAERRNDMAVEMPRRMRCDQNPFLFGVVGDP